MSREYRILIPLSPNGRYEHRHKGEKWDALKAALLDLAGGYTDAGVVEGAWKDGDKLIEEPCREFILSVQDEDKSKLDALLWCMLPKFDQKCIYVSGGGDVRFINEKNAPSEVDENWGRMVSSLGPEWSSRFRELRARQVEPTWIEGPVHA